MIQLMRPLLLVMLLAFSATAHAVGLPDTGQDTCYNNTVADSVASTDAASISGDTGTHPRQDCRYGRDAAAAAGQLGKIGGGTKGRDYSKIANSGVVLDAVVALGSNPTDWACTQDNITGLLWEVKTTSGLRSQLSTYTWYNSNATTNAGNAGTANGGTCSGGTGCDTEKFVADVNTAKLCGYTDWRMPSLRELQTLVLLDGSLSSIEPTYFPNTVGSAFWSSSSSVQNLANTWFVYFYDGYTGSNPKTSNYYVRLVRGGQF